MRDNTAWNPNVTVAAIIERDGRFLLVEEHTPDGLRFNNPAGHLDPGESLQQGAVRETLEETGCSFAPQALVGVYLSRFQRPASGQDVTYVRFAYCGTASDPVPGWVLDEGIVRTVWLSIEEIRACRELHRSPLLLAGIEDYRAGKRYPLDLVQTDGTVFAPEVRGAGDT